MHSITFQNIHTLPKYINPNPAASDRLQFCSQIIKLNESCVGLYRWQEIKKRNSRVTLRRTIPIQNVKRMLQRIQSFYRGY